jgi:hypothetical protein
MSEGEKPTVSQKEFETFWTWFGKSLHVIRYQRQINTLWQHGHVSSFSISPLFCSLCYFITEKFTYDWFAIFLRLIYGFMTREEVNAALSGQEPGTFVIRFRSQLTQHIQLTQLTQLIQYSLFTLLSFTLIISVFS